MKRARKLRVVGTGTGLTTPALEHVQACRAALETAASHLQADMRSLLHGRQLASTTVAVLREASADSPTLRRSVAAVLRAGKAVRS